MASLLLTSRLSIHWGCVIVFKDPSIIMQIRHYSALTLNVNIGPFVGPCLFCLLCRTLSVLCLFCLPCRTLSVLFTLSDPVSSVSLLLTLTDSPCCLPCRTLSLLFTWPSLVFVSSVYLVGPCLFCLPCRTLSVLYLFCLPRQTLSIFTILSSKFSPNFLTGYLILIILRILH